MTAAQSRMLDILRRESARAAERHGSPWVEWWDVAQEWGARLPLGFVGVAAGRTWRALQRAGRVEEHLERPQLVRPAEVAP